MNRLFRSRPGGLLVTMVSLSRAIWTFARARRSPFAGRLLDILVRGIHLFPTPGLDAHEAEEVANIVAERLVARGLAIKAPGASVTPTFVLENVLVEEMHLRRETPSWHD